MNWQDSGFLLSKNKYNENSIISECYTKNHGKITGIIFGGTSKKIKNYLQIGNKLHVNYNSKNDNILPKPVNMERESIRDINQKYRPPDEPCCKYDCCDLFIQVCK